MIGRELSVFIDESGDFGEYDYHSPYYIICGNEMICMRPPRIG